MSAVPHLFSDVVWFRTSKSSLLNEAFIAMNKAMKFGRRNFLNTMGKGLGAAMVLPGLAGFYSGRALHLSCNLYTWYSYYNRIGKDFYADIDAGLAEVKKSGLDGFEPSLTSTDQVDEMAPLLNKHGLEMRSVYVNSKLHIKDDANKSIDEVLAIIERCKPLGTKIVVTNPSPIGWGTPENKSDKQIIDQAEALDRLGASIGELGMQLAYHTHDSEFRAGAREFHHMMLATDPRNVSFCLDVHWVYRGAENSNVALFDVLELYGNRIAELHVRQSKDGIWTETFGAGDIDYPAVVQALIGLNLKPHIVLEQAAEAGTPQTMNPLEAHRQSQVALRKVFAPLGS